MSEPRRFYCNKCGYIGDSVEHPGCNYNASPILTRQSEQVKKPEISPESRKVLDDYRDSLLGDGVSETARMLIDVHVSQLELASRRLKVLASAVTNDWILTGGWKVNVRYPANATSGECDTLIDAADWLIAQEESPDSSLSAPASTSVTEKE